MLLRRRGLDGHVRASRPASSHGLITVRHGLCVCERAREDTTSKNLDTVRAAIAVLHNLQIRGYCDVNHTPRAFYFHVLRLGYKMDEVDLPG